MALKTDFKKTMLTHEDINDLVTRAQQGCQKARDRLTLAYRPTVVRQAGALYRKHKICQEDLENEGYIAVIRAIDNYDPEKSHFSHYVKQAVAYAMNIYCQQEMPFSHAKKSPAMRAASAHFVSLENQLTRKDPDMSADERDEVMAGMINDRVQVTVETRHVSMVRQFMMPTKPLDAEIKTADGTMRFSDILADENAVGGEAAQDFLHDQKCRQSLRDALSRLPERTQIIIHDRQLCQDEDDVRTLGDLSKQFGISPERVRQLEARGIAQITGIMHDVHADLIPATPGVA